MHCTCHAVKIYLHNGTIFFLQIFNFIGCDESFDQPALVLVAFVITGFVIMAFVIMALVLVASVIMAFALICFEGMY